MDPDELASPSGIDQLHRLLVARQVIKPTAVARLAFFALAVHVNRLDGIENRVALFTSLLTGRTKDRFRRGSWQARPTNDDERRAQGLLDKLDGVTRRGPGDVARAQSDLAEAADRSASAAIERQKRQLQEMLR